MVHIHADFETRSTLDLTKCGLDVYAGHLTTDAWCMSWAIDDGPTQLWKMGEQFPDALKSAIAAGATLIGHNVPFELGIWNELMTPRYDWPEIDYKNAECTMAMCYAMGLPGKLEKAAPALGIDKQKDMAGNRVMLQLAQPRSYVDGVPIWWDKEENPEKFETLYRYCIQDSEVERELYKRLLKLSPVERKIWNIDFEINKRGVQIDVEAAKKAIKLVEYEGFRLNKQMRKVTLNQVATCNATTQLNQFLESRGVHTESVAKADVIALLERPDLPEDCRKALKLRQEAAKTSNKKLEAMIHGVGPDGRCRGLFQYHGATTGRWAGRRIQLQNLPRPKIEQEEIEEVFKRINKITDIERLAQEIDIFSGSPLSIISDCIRGFLIAAPGNELIAADFANIEGRVLAWLAGEDWKVKAFEDFDKGSGPDIYILSYAKSFRCTLDEAKVHRQVGKVQELALGFGGGKGAFQQMARGYNVKVSDNQAEEIKEAWRLAHSKIKTYWYKCEDAAIDAVRRHGLEFRAGAAGREVRYKKSGSFLWARLPSGRVLCYPYPEVKQIDTPWGEKKDALTYMTEDSLTKKWDRVSTYGGSLVENNTQAVAADILREALMRLHSAQIPVVMHVHDEVVCEMPKGKLKVKELEDLISIVPSWGIGLPIKAEGWSGQRFRK